ncbi:hypothetical protein K502DRAFT_115727 [Neoconidiobolus thromboides FSU 785]|nr:hypothetical protein K502DRAFT_115727 [Neoconidiobolus thromboides FSU 785]
MKFFNTIVLLTSGIYCSKEVYDGDFNQPLPPRLYGKFSANYMQHKWNSINMSHVSAGMIYHSYNDKKIRVDGANEGGVLMSSSFDFANVTNEGVSNRIVELGKKDDQYYRIPIPAFPLVDPSLLITNNAIFTGYGMDELYGKVEQWNVIKNNLNVQFFIKDKKFIRYDFWSEYNRTYTTTRFFNIKYDVPSSIFKYDTN